MLDLLLVRVPNQMLWDEKLQAPLGLLSLASYVREQGFKVECRDYSGQYDPSRWDIPLARFSGVSATTGEMGFAKKFALEVKARRLNSQTVIGGAHASALPRQCVKLAGLDFAVVGAGECAMISMLNGNCDVPGVYYPDDGLVKGYGTGQCPDMDNLPIPAYDLLPNDSIVSHGLVTDEVGTVVTMSRGCPFNCAFCSHAIWGHRVYYYPAWWFKKNVHYLVESYGVTEVRFVDELFMFNDRYKEAMCTLKEFGLKWRTHIRADMVTEELVKYMADCGCVELAFGVESGSQRILDHIKKGIKVEENTRAVKLTQQAGMCAKSYLIIGLPGESWDTVSESIKWLLAARPDKSTLSTYQPLPGSEVFDHPDDFDISIFDRDWSKYWLLGYDDREDGFVATTEAMSVKDLVEARDLMLQVMRSLEMHI